jgi:ligand-binding sensor domain-containing protein
MIFFSIPILILMFIPFLAACDTLEVGIERTGVPDHAMATENAQLATPVATLSMTPTPSSQEGESLIPAPVAPPPGLVYRTAEGLWKVDANGKAVLISDRADALSSPDGTRVLYSERDGDDLDVWLADLSTGERRNLTETSDRLETDFCWWLARSNVVLLNSRPQEIEPGPGMTGFLAVVGVDGSDYRILDDQDLIAGLPAPSPDGRTIAYGSGGSGWLYRWGIGPEVFDAADYGLTGTKGVRLGSPAWSYDGGRLAWVVGGGFAVGGDWRIGIGVFDLATQTARLLHPYEPVGVGGWPPAPTWSPDGRWLAFTTWAQSADEAGLWVVQADGEQQQEIPLATGGNMTDGSPVWSPDSRWLILTSTTEDMQSSMWIAEVGTWFRRQIDLPPGAVAIDWLAETLSASALPSLPPLTPTPAPHPVGWITHTNPAFAVSLEHPANWRPVPGYGLPEFGDTKYAGQDGFFIVGAMNGAGIDEVVEDIASHKLRPYGSQPTIESLQIQGQEARLILPSADQHPDMNRQAELVVAYPQPARLGERAYHFFTLAADQDHIRAIAKTLRFASAETPASADWTNYPSLNDVHSLAFAPDGSLWAGTGSGVVRWDLDTDTYVRYSIADGLAWDDVTDLTFAPDSTLWAATRGGGVSHFNGMDWTTYTEADGLIDNLAYAIAVASEGSVWVGTQSGASHFDGTVWTKYTAADGLAADLIWYVAIAPDGDVWFSTHTGGVSRYNPDRHTWRTYGVADGLPLRNARFLATGPDGAPWLHIGYDHVYRFDGTTWQLAYEAGGGRWVCDMAFADDGSPWVATCDGYHAYGAGLAHLDGTTWTYVTTEDGLVDNDLSAVAVGQDGTIAAGTDRGISVYHAGQWRTLRTGPTLSQVTAVAVTPDGAVWFGFGDDASRPAGGGLSRFDGHDWQYLLGDAEVDALAVAPDGSLWTNVGCDVQRFDGTAWETVARCGKDLPAGNFHDIVFTSHGAAWLASGLGLAHFDGQSWTSYEKLVNSLAVAPDGAIWMNGWEGSQGSQYVARFDGENWTTFKSADSYPGGFMVGAVTPDGLVWGIAPERGLACFDGQAWTDGHSWTFYLTADDLSLEGISVLTVAPDGTLWAATCKGLAHFDGNAWEAILLDRDLGAINAMSFAADGSIWLGTSKGVVHFRW